MEVFDITTDGCTPLAAPTALPFTWAIANVRGFFIGTTLIPVGARELGLVISGKDAAALVRRVHYSGKVVPNSQLHLGVFLDGRLEGAACWRADGTPIGVSGGMAREGVRFLPESRPR